MTNPTLDLLFGHRSIRSFKPERVEDEKLDLILTAGTRAATPAEMQFYSLIVVDEPELVAKLDATAPVVIVACIDLHRHNRWMASRQAMALQGSTSELLFCFWDIAITLQNMAIAAECLGLGTLTAVREMHGLFDLPEGVYPAAILALGYAAENPDLRPRFPLEAVVHRNAYHVPSDKNIQDWYRSLDDKWDVWPREALERLGDSSCQNFAQVLSALLSREVGWIEANLRDTGYAAADNTA
ncbi:nitroreductase family protein [Candidatus Bipolaricaulota bacterium]